MANTPRTNRPYRIEVDGLRARSATTERNAKVALGAMMTQVANGTRGRIIRGNDTLLVAEAETLGWMTVLEVGARVTLERRGRPEQARIVRMVGYVAEVTMLDGDLAGRTLDAYIASLVAVPAFEVVAELEPELDGFDAWAAAAGELATELVDGFEVVR